MIYFGQSYGREKYSHFPQCGFVIALFLFTGGLSGGRKFSRIFPKFKWNQVSCIIAFRWFLSIHNWVHLAVKWSASNMNKFEFKDRDSRNPSGHEEKLLLHHFKLEWWFEGKWIFTMCDPSAQIKLNHFMVNIKVEEHCAVWISS